MNRYKQRKQQRLKNPEIAAGYREMRAELDLLRAIDQFREYLQISKEELAQRMGRKREAISRVLNAEDANPTLDTITELLHALGITAEITLRKSEESESPLQIETAL